VPDYDVVNPHKFLMLGHSFTSHFGPVYEAGIRSLLVETNATAAVAQFKDPWLIDYHDNYYDEDRNQGMSRRPSLFPTMPGIRTISARAHRTKECLLVKARAKLGMALLLCCSPGHILIWRRYLGFQWLVCHERHILPECFIDFYSRRLWWA